MPSFASERSQPAAIADSVSLPAKPPVERPKQAARNWSAAALVFAATLGAFWIGCAVAYVLGYIGPAGVKALGLQEAALIAVAVILPPALFVAIAWAIVRGQAMSRATQELSEKVQLLTTADETAAKAATRLGRAVRHELDALNTGIDAAYQRLRALENVLQDQIAALDDAGARADVRGQAIAASLQTERERLEAMGGALNEAAARAGETLQTHAAGLQSALRDTGDALGQKAAEAGKMLAGHTDGLALALSDAGEKLGDAAARAGSTLQAHTAQLHDAIAAAETALGVRAAEAGNVLSAHTDALAAKLQAAGGVLEESVAQADLRVAAHAENLKTALAAAGAALDDALLRNEMHVTDHGEALKAAAAAAEEALSQMSGRLDEQMAARGTQLKAAMAAAESVLDQAAGKASEHLAGRAAQLKALMEQAQATLHGAGQTLDKQAQEFRRAADSAADAPHQAAVELDKRAKAIESVADATMARAEFVLGRHERHRVQMSELLQKLRDEGAAFETALSHQRTALENAVAALEPEAKRFETLAADTGKQVERIMDQTAARAKDIAASLSADSARLQEIGQSSGAVLEKLAKTLRGAGESAHVLLGEASESAKEKARALVGEAMAECEKLVRAADALAIQSKSVSETLGDAVGDVQRHLSALPGIAQQEAQRVRVLMKTETEEILDISARTISALHAKTAARTSEQSAEETGAPDRGDHDSLLARARRLTQRPKRSSKEMKAAGASADGKNWDMSTLLAAVETSETREKELNPSSAAALGALEAALADMALDLSAFDTGPAPGEDEWRRYLAGDRAVFARRLANAIDSDAVNRITNLYRENAAFRDTADTYMREFEILLERAREGDGGGLLTSSMLSSDTGKIYLALAYALGRLL